MNVNLFGKRVFKDAVQLSISREIILLYPRKSLISQISFKETEEEKTRRKRRSCEDGSMVWSEATISQGLQKPLEAVGNRKNLLLGPSEGLALPPS
jgi:hypothetical protein